MVEIRALGYFMLTGQPPFVRLSTIKTLAAHLHETPAPPSEIHPDIPDDLEALVLRCLAKNPAGRYPDVDRLEQALVECRAAGQWSAKEAAAWWNSYRRRSARARVEPVEKDLTNHKTE